MIPHMKAKVMLIEKNKKNKNQNGRLKKAHFPAPPILNIFSQKFHRLVLTDGKGIHTAWIGIWMTKRPGATSDNGFILKKINKK